MSADIQKTIEAAASCAKQASLALRSAPRQQKDRALLAMAAGLRRGKAALLAANALDIDAAKGGLSAAMLDRLRLDDERIEAMILGLEQVADLPDPVGDLLHEAVRPNGLKLEKVRVPLGVVGGGSESLHSNVALGKIIQAGLAEAGLPETCIAVVATTDRAAVAAMLKLDHLIDVIIPRGGHGLIRYVVENSSIPVIRHDLGNCHVYVDAAADLKMAEEIAYNAKVQRPSVCNAMEHLLVHDAVAKAFLPVLLARYRSAQVELRGDEAV